MRTLRIESAMTTIARLCVASLLLALAACGAEEPAATTDQAPPPAAEPASPATDAKISPPVVTAGERLAQPCLSCHEAQLFAGRDADELVAEMQGIAAGDVSHPPLPATLSDEDLAEIAAFLGAQPADTGS